MKSKYVLSFPDSVKLLNESINKDKAIDELVSFSGLEAQKVVELVNECLYKNAKEHGISLYDLCFRTVPEVDYSAVSSTSLGEINLVVKLTPVEFDLTHDGGYWKNKYFDLKKRMQEIIDQ